MSFRFGFNESTQTPNFDDKTLDHYTDKQLQDFVLKNGQCHENVILEIVMTNSHCHGNMDLLTNIMDNTHLYSDTGDNGCKDKLVDTKKVFANPEAVDRSSTRFFSMFFETK